MAEEVCIEKCVQETEHEILSTTNVNVSVKEIIQMYERVAENMKNTQYIEHSVMTIKPTRTNIDGDVEDKKEFESGEPRVIVQLSKFHTFNRFLPNKTFFS